MEMADAFLDAAATDAAAAAYNTADAAAADAFRLDNEALLQPAPAFEEYRAGLPQELEATTSALVKELEGALQLGSSSSSSRFDASKVTHDMRQRLWDLLHGFNAAAWQQHINHELLSDKWCLPGAASYFFLRPPQTGQRQRCASSSQQQPRSFNAYYSAAAISLSNSTDNNRFLVYCTCTSNEAQYRLYTLATTAADAPDDNGHSWQRAEIKVPRTGKVEAWVDATVGLCVWEPASSHTHRRRRKRPRTASQPEATTAGDPLAAAIAGTAAAAAAGGSSALMLPHLPLAAQALIGPQPHSLYAAAGFGGLPGLAAGGSGGGDSMLMMMQQQTALAAAEGEEQWIPPLQPPQPPQPPQQFFAPMPAPVPQPVLAAGAGDVSSLLAQLQSLQLEEQRQQRSKQLLGAAMKGEDLLRCVAGWDQGGAVAGTDAISQQQQQQQQQQQLSDFLLRFYVTDKYNRNLLHIVATHSIAAKSQVSQQDRLQQLQQLTATAQLAARLMHGVNDNNSTPLMVAASGIASEADAAVFRALLNAADAPALLTRTKGGWTVLQSLANTAAQGNTQQLVQRLMRDTKQRVCSLADSLEAGGTAEAQQVARMLREGCLHAPEPVSRHYAGRQLMMTMG